MRRLGEWSFRGYLPHYDAESTFQLVTFRIADSLPRHIQEKLRELAINSLDQQIKIQRHLDKGRGEALLIKREHATIVQHALLHFHSERYNLHAWVIMPNHVHVLIEPMHGWKIGAIMKVLKGFTSREIAKREINYFQKHKRVWQPDYFDRYIRDHSHYRDAITYIHENPVKAGLAAHARDWQWSSAKALEKLR